MNETPIELTFDNRLSDHLAAERLYYRSTMFWKLDKVAAVLLLIAAIYFYSQFGPNSWTVVFFPLAIAEWFNLLSIRPIQITYFFKQNPKFRETYRLAFDRNGLRFKTVSFDSTIQWNHYTRYLENDRLFLLIYGSRMYTVIPKSAFAIESELKSFRLLVQECIGTK